MNILSVTEDFLKDSAMAAIDAQETFSKFDAAFPNMGGVAETAADEITCPICETRHKMSEYITVYTKTLDGRILKSIICPGCHISRGYVVEKVE